MQTVDISERETTVQGLKAFIMTLRPRRSADPRVAYTLCGILGAIWCCAGIFFTTLGGWPIVGFFGGEFIFIAGMVRVFIRRTDVVETVEITERDVIIHRRALGNEETQTFPAYWAQAHFTGSPTENGALEIRSHGAGVEIGRFLSAAEKHRTANTLNDALRRAKATDPAPDLD